MSWFQRRPRRDRLHVGCGGVILPGWINVDLRHHPGVDYTFDVCRRLPFSQLGYIFAEHFIEHLTETDGARFLSNCHRALRPGGVLRVSTPNLDWVMATHYAPQETEPDKRIEGCRVLNRAFHGWGHQFLYNDTTLVAALRGAGFDEMTFRRYGESNAPNLRGIEKHETAPDCGHLHHVLIVEARRS